ncbi:MAG: rhodanese-like domain-containing protein [Chitinophagales bacterium]|nr:rhodanese-like domain-containing protein [Chitinophagales bacterium]MCZ2392362.1 rhodanese-like domain-containing protein [Chitinophagales bacterium]
MSVQNLNVKDFKSGFETEEGAVIIDVRTPAELSEGQIEGHIMINVSDPSFPVKIGELDKSKPYYVYCRSGGRSGQVCNYMVSLGFEKIYNLVGGIIAWNNAR